MSKRQALMGGNLECVSINIVRYVWSKGDTIEEIDILICFCDHVGGGKANCSSIVSLCTRAYGLP